MRLERKERERVEAGGTSLASSAKSLLGISVSMAAQQDAAPDRATRAQIGGLTRSQWVLWRRL